MNASSTLAAHCGDLSDIKWNKVLNFSDPSTFGAEMVDRFVASGANLPPPVSNRVKP